MGVCAAEELLGLRGVDSSWAVDDGLVYDLFLYAYLLLYIVLVLNIT